MRKWFGRSESRWVVIMVPLLIVGLFLLTRDKKPQAPELPQTEIRSNTIPDQPILADLGFAPDWSQLDRFQDTISQETFLNRLTTVYTKNDSWKSWITIDTEKPRAVIGDYKLRFAKTDQAPPGSRYSWKTRDDLAPDRKLPLAGLNIALDPGHIGGTFARLEQREHKWGNAVIREGSMTLRTAEVLQPILKNLGASVTLVRSSLKPVTGNKARDFKNPRLFYRTSEIRARARLVNETIKPDLVICIHFNGSSANFPESDQHFHIILNGTYTQNELAHEDERFEMLQRLLSGTITEEIPLAREIAGAFNDITGLPAYRYPDQSRTAQNLANHPNLWARNLLANRLYQCPVIFLEPYVMNSRPFIERFRKDPTAIYQEYARAVAEGLTRYYSQS